jgi:TM2 domain-containing membrane protein YozV
MPETKVEPRHKGMAIFLAMFFGWSGAHNFYLGATQAGFVGLCTLSLGSGLSWFEAYLYSKMSKEEWDAKYNNRKPHPMEFVFFTQEELEHPYRSKKIMGILGFGIIFLILFLRNLCPAVKQAKVHNTYVQQQLSEWDSAIQSNDKEHVSQIFDNLANSGQQEKAKQLLKNINDPNSPTWRLIRPKTPEGGKVLMEYTFEKYDEK